MASSKVKYPVYEPEMFYRQFPRLTPENHTPTSHATPERREDGTVRKPYYMYNCFAYVVGDRTRYWWPEYPYSYWPRQDATDSVESLVAVLQDDYGYESCDNGDFEEGVQKVAIFADARTDPPVPLHIAIQPSSRRGEWFSKMGPNVDMQHDLRAIESRVNEDPPKQGYGTVVKFMKLVRKGRA